MAAAGRERERVRVCVYVLTYVYTRPLAGLFEGRGLVGGGCPSCSDHWAETKDLHLAWAED